MSRDGLHPLTVRKVLVAGALLALAVAQVPVW